MSDELLPTYCYAAERGGFAKVGLSFNPEKRMEFLGGMNLRFKLRLAPYKVAYNAESLTKGFLAPHLAGEEEWFRVSASHIADVLMANVERAFMAYCCDAVISACNHGMATAQVEALGLGEYVKAREYPKVWWDAREQVKRARRVIRLKKRLMDEMRRLEEGGDYPADWKAKLDQHKANKKRAAKAAK